MPLEHARHLLAAAPQLAQPRTGPATEIPHRRGKDTGFWRRRVGRGPNSRTFGGRPPVAVRSRSHGGKLLPASNATEAKAEAERLQINQLRMVRDGTPEAVVRTFLMCPIANVWGRLIRGALLRSGQDANGCIQRVRPKRSGIGQEARSR